MNKAKTIETVIYNWGEFKETGKIEKADLKKMVELSDELLGFTIRKEDKGKTFYAESDYIDEGEDGTSVKWAYAIGKDTIQIAKQKMFDLFTTIHYEAADNGESEKIAKMEKELEGLETKEEIKAFKEKHDIKKLFRLNR